MTHNPAQPLPHITARQWIVLAVLSCTVLMISLDQTVLNVALPTLIDDLRPSATALPWIADSYTLANAVFLILGGSLGDRYGHKRIFLLGLAVFGGGSLACALVHSSSAVIAARTVMGLGAALLMPATLSVITATFEGKHRARAIGIWAGVSGIGTAAGPLLGGWLLEHFWWGSVFLINIPVAVLGLAGGVAAVQETAASKERALDPVGTLLSAGGLALVTYGLIVGPDDGWVSAAVLGCFGGGVALLALFAAWNGRRRDRGLVDFGLFANRTFSSALGAVTAVFFALFGASYLYSQYFQFVQGADSLGIGLRFVPLAVGTLITSNVAARLTERFGLRRILVLGITASGAGLSVMAASIRPDDGLVAVTVAFALMGCGIGLVIAPASTAIVGSLPVDKVGMGSGLRSMVQLVGGSFGVAILGTIATSHYRSHLRSAFTGTLRDLPPGYHAPVVDQIGRAVAVAQRLPGQLGHQVVEVSRQAYTGGLQVTTGVGAAICVLALVAAARYVPRRVSELPQPPDQTGEDAPDQIPAAAVGD